MNTSAIQTKLLKEREYWQGVADHMAEQASMDPQSNLAFRMAEKKVATIDRLLRKILIGTFGRCDECAGPIEHERLELLIDSDCHVCAKCAVALNSRKTHRPVYQRAHPTYGHRNVMPEMA